jgi:signal transduction histidine kinase
MLADTVVRVATDGPDRGTPPTPGELHFEDGPQLELDQLLRQLVDRAQDVMLTQGRLRALLSANTMITSDLDLSVVLHRIVEAACQLVDAQYGALGVLAGDGSLSEFVYVGVDQQTVERIGTQPTGKGLVGALIDDPRPIRLRDIREDPRAVGLPAGHPPMTSFLGVPIRVRDEIFGNLYVTEAVGGEFSAEDEELLVALAATAGVAIENARLYAKAGLRENWLRGAAQITSQLLSVEGEEPLELIANHTRRMSDADLVSVVLPTADGTQLMVEVASGANADRLTGYSYPLAGTYAGETFSTGRPILVGDATADTEFHVHLADVLQVGPIMVLPLVGTQRTRGALVVGRRRGRHRFDEADLDMASTFANHAAIALELADARRDQQRVLILEERDRIARDLHDHVIQQLFSAGLTVQGIASGLRDDPRAQRLTQVVSSLDDTIRQIRTTIFQLRGQLGPQTSNARTRILGVVAEMEGVLGFEPRVEFAGPVDAVVSDEFVDDLIAVTREALTNTAKHAKASRAGVILTVTADSVVLEVIDDGIGIGTAQRRSGVANLQRRAERNGGTLALTAAPPAAHSFEGLPTRQGTHLTWTIPLR